MHTFKIGQKYYARSLCDYDCIFYLTVKSRTKKTIMTSEGKRLKIYNFGNGECVYPNGQYSMAVLINAESIAA